MDEDGKYSGKVEIRNNKPRKKRNTCKCTETTKLAPLTRLGGSYLKNNPTHTIEKLCKLVSDPVTNVNVTRICRLLHIYINLTSNDGHHVKNLPSVMQVLEFLALNSRNARVYQPYLASMLKLCCQPPLLEKASEGLFCAEVMEQYFTLLGYLLVILPTSEDSLMVHRALQALLTRKKPTNIAAVKVEACHHAVENSRLPLTVAEILEIAVPEIFPHLLDLTFLLVSISCYIMMEAGILNHLLIRLDPNYQTRDPSAPPPEIAEEQLRQDGPCEMLVQVTNIMWCLMRSILPPETLPSCLETLPSLIQGAMWSLRYAFKREVRRSGWNSKSSLMRNDLAVLILACLVALPSLNPVQCGLAEDLTILAVATELGTARTWAESVEFTASNEDLRFKKILLMIICHLVKFNASIAIMVERSVMVTVLHLINPGIVKLNMPWTAVQFWDLTNCALGALTVLLPYMPGEFIKHRGSIRLLMVIEWSMMVEFDVRVSLNCVNTLCSIVAANITDIHADLRQQGAVATLMKLAHHVLAVNTLTLQHQRILTHVMAILETLIKNQKRYQELYGNEGVKMVLRLLDRCLHQKCGDSQLDQRLLIAIGMLIWEFVVWCPMNLEDFVEQGATYVMLDVIEYAIFPVRVVFLGVLCDMCEGSRAGVHLCTWRGIDKNTGFMSLLARTWREEEIRIKVQRTRDGSIEDCELPLMGADQWLSTYFSRNNHSWSPTLVDMIASSRPKIYGIRRILEREAGRCQTAKDRYKILLQGLPTEDRVTMQLIDQYFRLAQGQIWIEVSRNLEQIGVTPLAIDGQMIFLMTQRHHRRSIYIKESQEEILKAKREAELKEEEKTYTRIRNAKLAPTLDALKEIDYIRRTTDRKYMLEKKNIHRRQVNEFHFPSNTSAENCHRTFNDNANFTVIMDQRHFIDNLQVQSANFGKTDYSLVSPSTTASTSSSFLLHADSENGPACRLCFLADLPCFHQ